MSGVQLTKGHLADNGGLRGHSVDAKIYPLVVVAVGNPHERLFWKVRRPDGQYYFKGFESAKLAELFAANVKAGLVDCMTEFEYRSAGGYVGIWLGEGHRPALHRQQTEGQYLAILKAKPLQGLQVEDNLTEFLTVSCFDGDNYDSKESAAESGALYLLGQYKRGNTEALELILKAANATATCLGREEGLVFCL